MMRIIAIATFAAVLAACATASSPATKYQAAPDLKSPGYLTMPSENGRFAVAFTGTKGMSRDQVARFALLRAAEFTEESGQEWFAVISTKTQSVQLIPQKDDLKGRTGGGFMGGPGGSSTGAGGTGGTATKGTADSTTAGGASTGGFGGGAPPTGVVERWTPPSVPQTVLIIQMGKGEKASFAGVEKAPEIFSAKTVAADIRSTMKP
jgi:hypothetical protein